MAGYNLLPFDGKIDFSIRQQKMKGILIQQKVFKAIEGSYVENVSEEKKRENDEFAYSSIILNLSDTVLRKVGKLESSKALWDRLEELYTEISLPNKLFLLEKFFRYKLDLSRNIDENLDDFTKLIQDIKFAGDKYIDEYSPIVLLNAIPESYSDVKAAIKYGRDSINIETVVSRFKSKELDLKVNKPNQNQHEINMVREEDGLEGRWGKGIMKIMKGSLVVFKAIQKRNLYICTVTYDNFAASVSENYKTTLWHKRLGHISMKGLDFLRKHGILNDKLEKLDFCDECVMGKHHRVHFSVSPSPNPSMSTCILDYAHADVWGPSNVPTHGGNRYFLSIIDNYSRKVFVFLMKYKSEVFDKFEKWKTLVENQTSKKLKSLRTDNGLEFCNKQFSEMCDKYGIRRHKTNPYTPQQNGVAERMNRTLLEKVRCLLISSGLSKTFWGEAVLTAAHLINLSPSVPLSGKIPELMWNGKLPDLSYLRVFGCSAFVHQNVDKLEPRSLKCIFIGYPKGVKGYRLWVRSQPGFKVLISRDVTFNENEMPCLEQTKPIEKEITFNKVDIEDNQEGEELENNQEQNSENLENLGDINPVNNPLDNYQLARDRDMRQTRIPSKLRNFHTSLNTELGEPSSVEEALKSEKWLIAMKEEMKSLIDNKTWVLVPKPKDTSIVDCKWLFKIKQENPIKYKARLVAKGFTQKEGIDYNEIFSSVVKYTTVRIILALTAYYDWELKQMDVKTAFLHGDLDENIYMSQPFGFSNKSKPDHVCLLKKSLYGLKQSPRQWNKKFDVFMLSLNFSRSNHDHCLYFKYVNDAPIFLVLYVDDMLIASPSLELIYVLQKDLCNAFEMKDLGNAKQILGMNIIRDRKTSSILLNQKTYLLSVLKKFAMENSKPTAVPLAAHFQLSKNQCPQSESEIQKMSKIPYSNVIGSIMFLMEVLKWLLRYLCESEKVGIKFSKHSAHAHLIGYVDSNYANDRDSRKSTTSYMFTFCNSCISWKSQLQHIVALSTTEAEYIATTEVFKEALWLSGLLNEISFLKEKPVIFSDSQSAIQLCKNPVFHDRTKHIDVRYHFIRDIVGKNEIRLEKISSDENPADMGPTMEYLLAMMSKPDP
ncbi:UNVERIFIED_CONTAM: Retrovirus-related Pol polyprotein from transposon TNT 1-94 [Sesamum indicum]